MSVKLFVGSFPQNTTEQTLRDLFSAHGVIISVSVVMDSQTRLSRGFGFVEMATEEAALLAIEKLNGSEVGDRKIVVKKALAKTSYAGMNSDTRFMRNKGGRRF